MRPPIFEYCSIDSECQSFFGTVPFRLYKFGEAPQGVTLPYCVWQLSGGSPENYLNQVPDVDNFTTQVDVYDDNPDDVEDAARALRDAIEPLARITSWIGSSRDPETKNYRFTFLVDWWTNRGETS